MGLVGNLPPPQPRVCQANNLRKSYAEYADDMKKHMTYTQ